VLFMISSMAVPICNYSHARQAKRINNHFLQGYRSLTPMCAGLLESRASGLGLLKFTFHAENFIRRLSWSISSHFGAIHAWNACCTAKLWKNSLKPAILGVKGHSRSSMLTFLRRSSAVLVVISSMSVPFWNHFYARYLVSLTAKIWVS